MTLTQPSGAAHGYRIRSFLTIYSFLPSESCSHRHHPSGYFSDHHGSPWHDLAAGHHGKAGEAAFHEGEWCSLSPLPCLESPNHTQELLITFPLAASLHLTHEGPMPWLRTYRHHSRLLSLVCEEQGEPLISFRASSAYLWVSSWLISGRAGVGFTLRYISPMWVCLLFLCRRSRSCTRHCRLRCVGACE